MGKNLAALFAAFLILLPAGSLRAADIVPAYASFGPFDVLGSGRNLIDVGLGLFEISNNHGKRSHAGRVEVRGGRKAGFVGPALGFLANEEGFRFGYAGIYADLRCGRFLLTPLLGAGIYHKGDSLDMGGPLEFRSSLEVAYRFSDRWQAGASIAHVSNADIYRVNPGQEDVLLTIAAGF